MTRVWRLAVLGERSNLTLELAQAGRHAIARCMTARRAIDSFSQIATLRIELRNTDPPIWRLVEVPTSITLKVLHDIVQVTMGWLDYHLWEIVVDGQAYGLSMEQDWGSVPRKVADRVRLRDVLAPGTTTIDYTYDFGDSWEHKLIISDVRPGDITAAYQSRFARWACTVLRSSCTPM